MLLGLSIIFAIIAVALIFLVELALYFVPVEKEVRMFQGWLPDGIVTVSPNDEVLNGTQKIVDRLSRYWPDSPYSFRLEIDDSKIANAMALPGGLIVVTQGLLDQVESENELAFVLGHELGHFRNRDHLRSLGRGVVLSIFIAAIGSGDGGGIGTNITDLALRNFSRRQERQADEFGLLLVQSQYGHVNEAWRFFERWDEYENRTAMDFLSHLSTHPKSGERIEDLREFAEREVGRPPAK